MIRGVWPYLKCPWIWARLTDPRINHAAKAKLAADIATLAQCCGDFGFTIRLQSVIKSESSGGPAALLPGGNLHSTVDMLSVHRVINVKIEDCFARASAQAQASRGGWKAFSYLCIRDLVSQGLQGLLTAV